MKKYLLTILFNLCVVFAFAQQPINLTPSNITSNSVDLNWDNGGCSANYTLRIRVDGTSTWQAGVTIPNTGSSEIYNLTSLLSSTTYNWKVKCGGNWTNGPDFTTSSGCSISTSSNVTDASCNTIMNGSIDLTVSNGATPYTFLWSDGSTTEDLSGVSNGTYIVNITDNSGCTTSDTITIGVVGGTSISQSLTPFGPNPITAYHQWTYDTLSIVNTACDVRLRPEFSINCSAGPIQQGDIVIKWQHPLGYNQNLDYTIDANGNANGYWSFTANDSTGTDVTYGQIQDVVVQVKFVNPAQYGTYTATWITYEVDNLGNIISTLVNPTNISVSLVDCSTFSIDSSSSTSTTCVGGTDGSASIQSVINSSGQYSYSWSNGSTQSSINNVAAGTYSCVVTDDIWGCVDSVDVIVPSADTLQAYLTGTNISCFGLTDGTLTGSASGGSGTYKYTWNPSLPLTATHTGLSSNTYILVLTDMGCPNSSSTDSFTISEPAVLSYTTASNNNTSCDINICNGSFGINLSGGTTPYSFTWTNGDTVNLRNNLCGGSYSITASDLNSCNTFTESVIIYDSTFTPSVLVTGTNISCNGLNDGSATAMISTGAGSSGGNVSTLTYCASSPGTNAYSNIELVRLVGDGDSISNNTSGTCDSYEDYTYQYTSLTPGGTYSIDVNLGTCTPGQNQIDSAGIFIDWNIDGDFTDPGEMVGVFGGVQSPISNTISFTVPNGYYGATRMRIVSQAQIGNIGFPDGPVSTCVVGDFGNQGTYNQPWYGATEDYSIVIVGAVPATYLWNTGDTTNIISNLSAGTYYCIVSDTNNCSTTDTITISQPPTILVSDTTTNVSCNGLSDGTAILLISGGTPGYTEDWGINNPLSLSAGTYNYTINDTNSCTYTSSVTITEPQILSATYTQTNVSCNGLSDGSAFVNISGGTIDYLLSWDTLTYPLTGGLTVFNTPIGVPSGIYPFGITDANGCYFTDTITISEPSAILVSETTTNVSCNGLSDGTATLSISGGIPGYTEDWGTNNPLSLSAGTYNYTITDSNSCIYTSSVTITEPSVLNSYITPTDLTSCLISNGSIDLTVIGGTSPYTYLWNNNDTTEDLSNLPAGNYSVIITDANSCTDSNSNMVNQPSNGLSLSLSSPSNNGYNIACFGENSGSIITNSTGGTGSLTYIWSSGDTTQNISNLFAGSYSVAITDSVGCSLSDSISITEPFELTSVDSTINVMCYSDSTGSAIVNFSGGVTDYILSWTGYTYPLLNGLTTFITPVGVPAGIYPYSVMDANGCFHFDTITITEPTAITVSSYTTNVSCNGGNNGTSILTSSGGTGTLNENWGGNNPMAFAAGTYNYIVTDDNLCVESGSVTITEPTSLILSLSGTDNSCYNSCDGEITSSVSGGVSPYTYSWDNGSNSDSLSNLCIGHYLLDVTDSNGCIISDIAIITQPSEITINTDSIIEVSVYDGNDGEIYITTVGGIGSHSYYWTGPSFSSTNEDLVGLFSGDYIITVTDSTNCSNSDTIFVNQPPSLSIYIDTVINLLCFEECNGEIKITADGGDSVYTYLWIGPNGFTSTDKDLDSLCAGTYEIIVSDTTSSITTTITILQPTQLQMITNVDTALCVGGTAQATAYTYGGQYPYITNWDNGTSAITAYLTAGIHYVNVQDFNGCSISDSVMIIQNDSIIANTITTDISCYGLTDGSVEINIISGGTSPFTYSSNNGVSFQYNNVFSSLNNGTYSYIIMDDNGCTTTASDSIIEPAELVVSLTSTPTSCNGECDGTSIATSSGGTGNITENWGILDPNNLCAGLANVIVEDDNGCLSTNSVIITEPNPVIVIITANGNSLDASSVSVIASYQWFDGIGNAIIGATSQSYTPTIMGEYYVEVTDQNGCIGESTKINFIIESIENENNLVSVYPNPTNSWITISSSVEITENIRIINTHGETVITIEKEEIENNSKRVNMDGLSKGIYLIQLINNDYIINHKVILQ